MTDSTHAPGAASAAAHADTPPVGVRTRFAPSPTGFQHIGGYRTALFSWLLARHAGGEFLLRIEDTDIARTVPGSVEALIAGFSWLGMDINEGPGVGGPYGPYFQTQRRAIYLDYAERLIANGHAYRCFCSRERLQAVRDAQRQRAEPPRYDRHCRGLSAVAARARAAAGEGYVVRLAVPLDGQTTVRDALREAITFENANLDDAVLLKSDGYPTYHLAAIVDDHLMRISHVVRAEEWISSAPLHVMIYQGLGWEAPRFVHVPDVLSKDGKGKLSKRHGALPMLEYRDLGYLPEAVLNYMALLGWSSGESADILSLDQLIEHFTLERVGTSPARYDEERLLAMNGRYIRQLPLEGLVDRALPFMERPQSAGGLPDGVARPLDRAYVARVLRLEQERMKLLAEAPTMTAFFFTDRLVYESALLMAKQMDRERTLDGLRRSEGVLAAAGETWEAARLEPPMRALVTELGMKPVQLFTSLRVAVTGRTISPPLFETMEVLGREVSLARLRDAIARLASPA
ncbi:MAG: glutamate--tRNA ligase [Ktedonobacterales bacterium]|nr:glutamate--tRNA ligase [Ktedonobacterales bacterium]